MIRDRLRVSPPWMHMQFPHPKTAQWLMGTIVFLKDQLQEVKNMVSGHLCGALFVNQLTPEDNEVVPQNDTILEISIIESSNINGLLMQT